MRLLSRAILHANYHSRWWWWWSGRVVSFRVLFFPVLSCLVLSGSGSGLLYGGWCMRILCWLDEGLCKSR